uniref:Uncharacterized protein n=1 Tax=Anopheles atroparvus TaxID=41427 RepID=A0A182J0N0_ANOAO
MLSCCSKLCSCCMKWKLGETSGLRERTSRNASFSERVRANISDFRSSLCEALPRKSPGRISTGSTLTAASESPYLNITSHSSEQQCEVMYDLKRLRGGGFVPLLLARREQSSTTFLQPYAQPDHPRILQPVEVCMYDDHDDDDDDDDTFVEQMFGCRLAWVTRFG